MTSTLQVRPQFKRPVLYLALLPTLLLGACNQPATVAPLPGTSQPAQPGANMPRQIRGGLYELTLSGAGTAQPSATLIRRSSLAAQDVQEVPSGLSFTFVSSATFDQSGTRYMQASYRVTNTSGRTLNQLSFVPVDTDGGTSPTVGTTALKDLKLFDGSSADSAASSISLGNAKTTDASGNVVNAAAGGTYTTDPQYASMAVEAPSGMTVTPKNAAWVTTDVPDGGTTLVTFSTSYPINASGALNPYKFTLVFASASTSGALSQTVQKQLAFTPGVNPAADPSDPNWQGQAIVRQGGVDYLVFKVYSAGATAMSAEIKDASGTGQTTRLPLVKDSATNLWYGAVRLSEVHAAGASSPSSGLFDSNLTYGLRAWGPNWTYNSGWTPGTGTGFISDVDASGNRFNPNKLLLDPYALEITHDYLTPSNLDASASYTSGATNRNTDTGNFAPRAYVALTQNADWNTLKTQVTHPSGAQKDDAIYEVHVRGFTRQDGSVTAQLQGTYAGAAQKASYLKSLGVNAVEFLPIQETENDGNDADGSGRSSTSTAGDNYWGYMTTNYFAPDRRYSSDKTAGGPTREFAEMAKAFKTAGIKLLTDVVYNHTGEGGLWNSADTTQANLWSMRGLDNPTYYLLTTDKQNYYDITGTGNTMNTYHPQVQKLIIDSLKYQRNVLGVDGFRFDLGIALGNTYDNTINPADTQRFYFSQTNSNTALAKVAAALPGVFLSSEPWGLAPNGQGYQLGNLPAGWSEWNGQFRDYFRRAQNKLDVAGKLITPGQLISRFAGSSDLFGDDGRKPWNSVNFLNVHDGMTLKDLYSCNGKYNTQPWPLGPSDGGTDDEDSWDNNDTTSAPSQAQLQRQQARNGMAFLTLSQGIPIFNGGDEFLRSLNCNNNPYNLDSSGNWLNWSLTTDQQNFRAFTTAALNFRQAHPALRRADFFTGTDSNSNGYKDVQWLRSDGVQPDNNWYNNTSEHAMAFLIDGTEQGDSFMYVAYNAWKGDVTFTLPTLPSNLKWYRVTDTAWWGEGASQFDASAASPVSGPSGGGTYGMKGRSVLLLIAKP